MDSSTSPARDVIAQSWLRAEIAGVSPDLGSPAFTVDDVDLATPLLSAARPVLDHLENELGGTPFTTLVVDRDGRIAHRWSGTRGALRALDYLGLDIGVNVLENVLGTNAPGVALETRDAVRVHGTEHFALQLRGFSCYAHPIFNPATRRIEGVLDISTSADGRPNPLLPALVGRAVADIEQRLLDGSRASERALFSAFHGASGHRHAVLALSPDVVMSNRAASELVDGTDITLLRLLVQDLGSEVEHIDLELQSGVHVRVRSEVVTDARSCTLLHVTPTPRPSSRNHRPSPDATSNHGHQLIAGASGTGRSTQARALVAGHPHTALSAASAVMDGQERWARDFQALTRAKQGMVVVDGIDLLPEPLVDLVVKHAETAKPPRLVLVSGPIEALTGQLTALAALCGARRNLAPLSERGATAIRDLAVAMLSDVRSDSSLFLSSAVLELLAAHPWPGNLRELRAVINHAASQRSVGALTVRDLPEDYRSAHPLRHLSPLERAERETIITALREAEGNKAQAARSLQISRSTLYNKFRTLQLDHSKCE